MHAKLREEDFQCRLLPTPCWHDFPLVFVSQALFCHGTKFHKLTSSNIPILHLSPKVDKAANCIYNCTHIQTNINLVAGLAFSPPTTQPTNLLVVARKLNLLISPTNSHSTMATSTLIILFCRNVENFQTFFSSKKIYIYIYIYIYMKERRKL